MVFARPVCSQHQDSVLQKDIVDVFFQALDLEKKEQKRNSKKIRFSIIPIAPASSGGKQVVVSSLSAAFYLGAAETTNLSNVLLIPYFDFKGSGGLYVRPTLWTSDNRWNISGELRLLQNYQYTYGLGANTSSDARSTVKFRQFRFYGVVDRRIINNFLIGGGVDLDYFYAIEEQNSSVEESAFEQYGIGTSGESFSPGLVFNLLRDSRTNSINPRDGYYTTLIFKGQDKDAGSKYSWSSVYFDARKYFSFHEARQRVLAFWFLYWGTFGDVPYLNLPGTSVDYTTRSGRGYAAGRYRGKQMLYGETEYRFDIAANGLWGGVVFANLQSYTELDTERFEYIKIAGGAGLRLKFDKKSNTNLTLDFGVGRDSYNLRLNLGEVF